MNVKKLRVSYVEDKIMTDERFRVATTNPKLKDKIKISIEDNQKSNIYWYIKFNVPLDKSSVTNKTMSVMDTDGYLMRTYIAYDPSRDVIVVSPMDSYIENKYYILGITTDVRSARGNHLKKDIHILFMLINNKVSKFHILKNTRGIPEQKPRPDNYDKMLDPKRPNNPIKVSEPLEPGPSNRKDDNDYNLTGDSIKYKDIKLNTTVAVSGAIIAGVGFATNMPWMFFIGMFMFILGFYIIFRRLHDMRAKVFYNMGAYNFKKKKYYKALEYVQKSFDIDRNEMSRHALRTIKKYVSDNEDF